MKNLKKALAFFLVIVLSFGLFACTPNGGSGAQNGDKNAVTLTWYTRGPGMQNDTSKVNDAFNALLHTYEGFENINVKFVPL